MSDPVVTQLREALAGRDNIVSAMPGDPIAVARADQAVRTAARKALAYLETEPKRVEYGVAWKNYGHAEQRYVAPAKDLEHARSVAADYDDGAYVVERSIGA